jgi:DNA-binding LacI/PurR family transcriptional regulator
MPAYEIEIQPADPEGIIARERRPQRGRGWVVMPGVARMAGASMMSVSRADQESCRVSPEARARIAEAAGMLGYAPNRAAAQLRSCRSASVAAARRFVRRWRAMPGRTLCSARPISSPPARRSDAAARGWTVPGRIAVAHFGVSDIAAEIPPGLTTAWLNPAGIGRAAGRMLLSRIAGEVPAELRRDLGAELVGRGTG